MHGLERLSVLVYLFRMKGLLPGLLTFVSVVAFAQEIAFSEMENHARDLLSTNQRDSLKPIAMQMQQISKQNVLRGAIAKYYLSEGVLYEDPEKAIALAAASLQVFRNSNEPLYAIRALKSKGNGFKLMYEYDSAVSSFEAGLKLIEDLKIREVRLEALLSYGLGATLRERSRYEEAINSLQRASDLSEELKDSTIDLEQLSSHKHRNHLYETQS